MFPNTAAIAMIGTACCGPKQTTRIGIRISDAPVPTMPLIVPATRPTARTRISSKRGGSRSEALKDVGLAWAI